MAKTTEAPDERTHDQQQNDDALPVTPMDDHPRQPTSVPPDGPLRSKLNGETYDEYVARCASYGAPAMRERAWDELEVT